MNAIFALLQSSQASRSSETFLGMPYPLGIIIAVVGGLVFLAIFIALIKYFNLYIQSVTTRANIGLFQMVGMSFQKVNPAVIVRAKVQAVKAGLQEITTEGLVAHYLAGGDVVKVVVSLIAADRANIPLNFRTACGIDLAGRDVLDAVQTSVNPKVIDCPDTKKGKSEIAGVAKNGIQVLARARVTVRTNIARLVGGATEETIIARVGEGIVAAIGQADSHKDVLESPDRISKTVLAKGLDAGTAFEIVSIDIADVDVGTNIGARLQADQAEADKRVAQANAEKRRAMAVAAEQEQKAEVVANRAKVIAAEAQIPMAMAEALRSGRMGVMDLYRMRNIEADTQMRTNLGGKGSSGGEEPRKE